MYEIAKESVETTKKAKETAEYYKALAEKYEKVLRAKSIGLPYTDEEFTLINEADL